MQNAEPSPKCLLCMCSMQNAGCRMQNRPQNGFFCMVQDAGCRMQDATSDPKSVSVGCRTASALKTKHRHSSHSSHSSKAPDLRARLRAERLARLRMSRSHTGSRTDWRVRLACSWYALNRSLRFSHGSITDTKRRRYSLSRTCAASTIPSWRRPTPPSRPICAAIVHARQRCGVARGQQSGNHVLSVGASLRL